MKTKKLSLRLVVFRLYCVPCNYVQRTLMFRNRQSELYGQ